MRFFFSSVLLPPSYCLLLARILPASECCVHPVWMCVYICSVLYSLFDYFFITHGCKFVAFMFECDKNTYFYIEIDTVAIEGTFSLQIL